jgi:hypothetical protein
VHGPVGFQTEYSALCVNFFRIFASFSDGIKIYEHGPTVYQLKKLFGANSETGAVVVDVEEKAPLRWPIRVWAGETFMDPKGDFWL